MVVQLAHAPLPVAVCWCWWTSLCSCRDVVACSSSTWLKCAVFVVMSSPPLSWRRGRFLWSVPVFLLLQHIDKVVVVLYVQSCGRQSSSHSCSLDKVVDMPVLLNDSPCFNVHKTAVVPQLLRVFLVADVPVVQVVLVPLSAAMDAQ